MRNFIILMIVLFNSLVIYAGGQAETGRSQAASDLSQGQLLPVGALDPANYLDDFQIEIENSSDSPLIVQADLLKDVIRTNGEDLSLRISLATNNKGLL